MDDASCVGEPPELFEFEDRDYDKWYVAQKICKDCPVSKQCLDSSSADDRYGTVRGGLRPRVFNRGLREKQEVCHKGHSNWGTRASKKRGGERYCKDCKAERSRSDYRNRKVS